MQRPDLAQAVSSGRTEAWNSSGLVHAQPGALGPTRPGDPCTLSGLCWAQFTSEHRADGGLMLVLLS